MWNLDTYVSEATLNSQDGEITYVTFSNKGNLLASCCNDNTIAIYDVQTFILILTLSGHNTPIYTCLFSDDDRFLFVGTKNGQMKIWNIELGI